MLGRTHEWEYGTWIALLLGTSLVARAEPGDLRGPDTVQKKAPQATGVFDAERWARFVFPPLARMMLQWPDEIVLGAPNRIRVGSNRKAATAREKSLRWIVDVIHRDWLPTDPNALREQFVLIRDWHGRLDVTFVRWRKNSHEIQVAQSSVLFAIKLSPLDPKGPPVTLEDKTDCARTLCLHLFNRTHAGRTKVIQGVRDKIGKYAFSEALILEAPGSAIGVEGKLAVAAPWPMELDTTGRPRLRPGHSVLRGGEGPIWCRFRWYTNGKQLGLCGMKEQSSVKTLPFSFGDTCAAWF